MSLLYLNNEINHYASIYTVIIYLYFPSTCIQNGLLRRNGGTGQPHVYGSTWPVKCIYQDHLNLSLYYANMTYR